MSRIPIGVFNVRCRDLGRPRADSLIKLTCFVDATRFCACITHRADWKFLSNDEETKNEHFAEKEENKIKFITIKRRN